MILISICLPISVQLINQDHLLRCPYWRYSGHKHEHEHERTPIPCPEMAWVTKTIAHHKTTMLKANIPQFDIFYLLPTLGIFSDTKSTWLFLQPPFWLSDDRLVYSHFILHQESMGSMEICFVSQTK